MQRYLSQLLAELKAAHDMQPPPIDYRLLYPEYAYVPDEIAYVVEWENAPEQSFEELFGIAADAFPPDDQLSDEQVEQLVEAILDLWAAWRMSASLPEGAPPRLCYQALVDFWRNDKISYSSEGVSTLYFCNCHVPSCLWGEEFCGCQHLEGDWDFDDPGADAHSDLPF